MRPTNSDKSLRRLASERCNVFMHKQVPFSRDKYRAARRRFVRANLVMLLGVTGLEVAMCIALARFVHGYALGLLQGVFLTAWVAALVVLFHGTTGSMNQLVGAWGEENTIDVLRRAKRRGLIWGWVDGLATESGDVDHIVVTKRCGVVAIDSKWHSRLYDDTVERDLVSAHASARRARLILLTFGRRIEVTPVAAIWGGVQHEIGSDQTRHPALVPGKELFAHLRALNGQPIDRATGLALLAELREHGHRVRPSRNLEARSMRRPSSVRVATS